jgi:hypothetical protein
LTGAAGAAADEARETKTAAAWAAIARFDMAQVDVEFAAGTGVRIRMLSPRLAAHVRQLVRAPGMADKHAHMRRGRLDGRALVRGSLGAGDCFSRSTMTDDDVAAVYVLVDGSQSMTDGLGQALHAHFGNGPGSRIRAAMDMAAAIGDAVHRAGAEFEISAYGIKTGQWIVPGEKRSLTTHLSVLKPMGRGRASVPILHHFMPYGGTEIMPAIMAAGERFIRTTPHATRRIMLVLTDGDDQLPKGSSRAACELLAARGVTVAGLGIGLDAAHQFQPGLCARADSVAEFADAGAASLVNAIRRGPLAA